MASLRNDVKFCIHDETFYLQGINKFVLKLNNLEVYNRHGQLVNVNSWLLKNGLAEKQVVVYLVFELEF